MYFSLPPSRNKRYFCSSLSCWEDHLHAQLLFTAPGRPQDGRPKGERLQWIRLQTPAGGFGHLYYLPKPGVGSLITYFYNLFLRIILTYGCSFGHRDEENFCATVPKDGRSYSPTLFCQTVRVLKKINKPGDMIVSFSLLADKIKVNWITMHIYLGHTTFSGSHGCLSVCGNLAVSLSVTCRQASARRGDLLWCSGWISGSHHVYLDAWSGAATFFKRHSGPFNNSTTLTKVWRDYYSKLKLNPIKSIFITSNK